MIINAAKAREAAEVLGVGLDGLTLTALTQAYRKAAKGCHPDHHGSEKIKEWARVSWARECLKHWLEKAPTEPTPDVVEDACRACGGKGRVPVRKTAGFGSPLTVLCLMCNGSGIAAQGGEAAYTGD